MELVIDRAAQFLVRVFDDGHHKVGSSAFAEREREGDPFVIQFERARLELGIVRTCTLSVREGDPQKSLIYLCQTRSQSLCQRL